jgi:foldase protein PrsA
MLGESKMKKSLFALTLAASLGLAACSNSSDVVVSTSYGDISQAEFYEEIKRLAGTASMEGLLDQVVVEKILSEEYEITDEDVEKEFDKYAEEYGEQFEALLSQSGFTEDTFKDNLRFEVLKNKAIAETIEVTDEEIKNYYEQAKYELNGRHILVETAEEAAAIIEELKAGADFAKIAKEKSVDTVTGAEGGELGWFTVGKMVPAFNDAAYALELNTISEPVQSDYGFHIIEITDKREVEGFGSLEDEKESIKEKLTDTKILEADWEAIKAKLLEKAEVEVKDEDLKGTFPTEDESKDDESTDKE